MSAARREVIRTTVPDVQFTQYPFARVSSPIKHGFGMPRAATAVRDGHLCLKLTRGKTVSFLAADRYESTIDAVSDSAMGKLLVAT